jgi:hypothetical protein
MKKELNNLIDASDRFGSNTSPDAYRISIHVKNMIITYGEDYVKDVITKLFLKQQTKKVCQKKVVGTQYE